ncbi:MAG: TolC family protein [Flavipsychrobacter sp.]|nr:TolC family protein [Flavipsychrobacter sp.]
MKVKKLNSIITVWLLLWSFAAFADTTRYLSKDEFISVVRAYHPVVKQADIQVAKASADIQRSRGAFDPRLAAGAGQKTFGDKVYYNYLSPELTIPTWYGVEFKAGLDNFQGDRLNQDVTVGKVTYAGMKVPVNGLLYDKRRAALQQAKIFKEMSEADRKLAVNELLFDAIAAYWNWVKEYQIYQAVSSLVEANEERMKFLRVEVEQGSRPAIDTVEGDAQYQVILQQQNNALINYRNAGLDLSNYMWMENGEPLNWTSGIAPERLSADMLPTAAEVPELSGLLSALDQHPKLQTLDRKISALEIDQKVKTQDLLPKLSLSANMLSKGYGLPGDVSSNYLSGNHKVSLDFGVPLFQREARGGLQAAKLKIEETGYEKDRIALQIENKIKSYHNEYTNLQLQLKNYERALSAYQQLYRGEDLRFKIGESTMFLLNSREIKVLEAMQKLIELKAKCRKAHAGIFYAAGMLN